MRTINMAKYSLCAYKGWNPENKTTDIDKLKLRVKQNFGVPENDIDVVEVDDLLFYIVKYKNETVISIRGTNQLRTWLYTNARILKTKTKYGRCHKGFWEATLKLLPHIKDRISINENVVINAHSLGASLSIILAHILKSQGYRINEVWAFEPPNIFDKRFLKNYLELNIKTFIVINNMDIVPLLPPMILNFFKPMKELFYFNGKKEFSLNPSRLYRVYDRTIKFIKDRRAKEAIEDHLMEEVVEVIKLNIRNIVLAENKTK